MTPISVRIPDEEAEKLDEVAALLEMDRSTTIRRALTEGMHDLRVWVAIEQYQTGDVSMNQAARIADVNLGEWLEIAREHNLTSQLAPDELETNVEASRDL